MSIIERIPGNPNGARVRYPVNRFSAPFAAGQYNFAQPGNTDQLVMNLQANSVYLIEKVFFFGAAAESDWLTGMDTVANFPRFTLRYRNDAAQSIYPEPVRTVKYLNGVEQLVFFWSTREKEDLLITFTGIVNQVAGLVGVDPLLCEVDFVIYQITDERWNREFIRAPSVLPLGSV